MAIAQPPPEPVTCGYDYNIFISTPPESLECPVCLLIVRKPHLTACCGALICQVCIKRIQASQQNCPCCRSDHFTTLLELQVRCENYDCVWKGELGELHRHLSNKCQYVIEKCRYGCGKYYYRHSLQFHEQEECPNRPLEAKINKKPTKVSEKYKREEESPQVVLDTRIIKKRLPAAVKTGDNHDIEGDVHLVVIGWVLIVVFAVGLFSVINWVWMNGVWMLLLWIVGYFLIYFLGQRHSELKTSLILVWLIVGLIVNVNMYQTLLSPEWLVHFSSLWSVGLILLIGLFWSDLGHVLVISIKILLVAAVTSMMLVLMAIGLFSFTNWYRRMDTVWMLLLWIVGYFLIYFLGQRHSEKKSFLILVWLIVGLFVNVNMYQTLLFPEWLVHFSSLWSVGLSLLIGLFWRHIGDISIKTLLVMVVTSTMLVLMTIGLFSFTNWYWMDTDGMQVISEKHFAVTGGDSAFTLDWVQFGLHIEIPEGSLPAGHRTELHVKAIIAGDFILPPDCYLVSGIYQISISEQFKKNVTLRLPHAAIIKSEDEASYFRFYTADCSSGPPYEFKEMEGGYFRPHSNSATIDVHHFCCITTGSNECPDQQYVSQVFYQPNSVQDWNMVLAVTKDEPIVANHAKKQFHGYDADQHFPIELETDAKYLEFIPENRHISSWDVVDTISPRIARKAIEHFDMKKNYDIPHCAYNFYWNSDSPPSRLSLKFTLVGTCDDEHYTVILPKPISQDIESNENKGSDNVIKSTIDDKTGGLIPSDEDLLVHLHDVVKVKSFCVHLKLTLDDCNQIAKENPTLDDQKIAILTKWKQIKERTWKEFIRPFGLLGNCVKAKKLTIDHSVYFEEDDNKVLEICKDINNHD